MKICNGKSKPSLTEFKLGNIYQLDIPSIDDPTGLRICVRDKISGGEPFLASMMSGERRGSASFNREFYTDVTDLVCLNIEDLE